MDNIIKPFNLYDKLKDKDKKLYRENSYANDIINMLIEMFDYTNLPKATNKVALETFLHSGACAMDKDGKIWIATPREKLNDDLEYKKVFCTDILGNTMNAENGVDVIVGYNCYTKTPSTFIEKFAYDLSQIDLSMECNLRYARLNKGYYVEDENEKIKLDTVLKKANEGENAIFINKNLIHDALFDEGNNETIKPFELTDVDKIDRLQYLSNFREDTIKNFWRKYGLNMNGFTKLAQQSVDEINDSAIYSMVMPTVMLKCRQEFVEKVNEFFGFNISVDFSDLWKRQNTDALTNEENEVNEGVETNEENDED